MELSSPNSIVGARLTHFVKNIGNSAVAHQMEVVYTLT